MYPQGSKTGARKPDWLKRRLGAGPAYEKVRNLVNSSHLHTVCQEAHCPNIWECFSRGTSTFLIMGPHCTRACRFCAVSHGRPAPTDRAEPLRVAEAVKQMGLTYIVLTSVTRDDLPDGGAGVFAQTITEIRKSVANAAVEVLIPDFQGDRDALRVVMDVGPAVLNHNLETVPRLYPRVRPNAVYGRSLDILKWAREADPSIPTKSGLMLGLGESDGEVEETLKDLLDAGCSILTLGQYLQPSRQHLPVERYVHPDEFDRWRDKALEMGFRAAASGPFVRSSYQAEALYEIAKSISS
ncbi:MAG: lipoyl synthase [Deltaproteobacteria bacterium]|nr:lipoyl synthase [Deltaproteobacteria bacterium]